MNTQETQLSRIIRIETNPHASVKIKVKMAKNKVDTFGRPMKTQKDGKSVNSRELVDAQSMVQFPGTIKYLRAAACKDGLATGLNVMVNNPYKDLDYYDQVWGERTLQGQKKALLQHILEYKHNVELGYYTNRLTTQVNKKGEAVPFFHSTLCKFPLEGNVFFLDLSNNFHEVMYYVAKANDIIANSYDDLQNGRNNNALYYIVDELEAANIKTVKSKRVNEAIAVIEKLEDDKGELVRFGKALGLTEPIANDKQAYESLQRYFKQDTINYENFMFYWKMYNKPINKDQFEAAIVLFDAIEADVITYNNGVYYWQKPATDSANSELLRWMSKDKVISNLLVNPKSKDDLEVITLLIAEYKRYNL